MTKLRQLCTATVFTLVLSVTALAGDMETPGVTPTPTCQSAMTSVTSKPVGTTGRTLDGGATVVDSALEIAQYLFDSMMYSIF
jgi:hypothetical protein